MITVVVGCPSAPATGSPLPDRIGVPGGLVVASAGNSSSNLPSFPAFTHQGTAICWDSCDPQAQVCTNVSVDTPVRTGCDTYTASFFSPACQFGGLVGGTLNLDYTRTWTELDTNNRRLQVYRFVVKADLVPGAIALPACAVLSHASTSKAGSSRSRRAISSARDRRSITYR